MRSASAKIRRRCTRRLGELKKSYTVARKATVKPAGGEAAPAAGSRLRSASSGGAE